MVPSLHSVAPLTVQLQGCSTPRVPEQLSASAATNAGFAGPVLHSIDFGPRLDDLLASVAPEDNSEDLAPIVVIGGGKSAQEYVLTSFSFIIAMFTGRVIVYVRTWRMKGGK